MAKRATRPPSEYPTTLIFLMSCPSFLRSSSFCSTSLATRSPPVSTPSYVKLPALRFATRISTLSSGNLWRRESLTCLRCSGLPHSLVGVNLLLHWCLPEARRTREQEHTDDLLFEVCGWMQTWLMDSLYALLMSEGTLCLCVAPPPGLVRCERCYRAQPSERAEQSWRHVSYLGFSSDKASDGLLVRESSPRSDRLLWRFNYFLANVAFLSRQSKRHDRMMRDRHGSSSEPLGLACSSAARVEP